MPLYPPQTPHAARTRTRAAAVWSQRVTAWATARLTTCEVTQRHKHKFKHNSHVRNNEWRIKNVFMNSQFDDFCI
jgi:hypothetical protein